MNLGTAKTLGKIQATDPAKDDGTGEAKPTDETLPDPTHYAVVVLGIFVVVAGIVAIVCNAFGWTGKEFDPAKTASANFALFASFYVAAQVIERLMQLLSPFLPFWKMPTDVTGTAKAAQIKADRGMAALGVAAVLGVAVSCGFGLFFLSAIGIHASHTIDAFVTGITIAAGTKPLHDFIGLLQKQTAPTTGTTAK